MNYSLQNIKSQSPLVKNEGFTDTLKKLMTTAG